MERAQEESKRSKPEMLAIKVGAKAVAENKYVEPMGIYLMTSLVPPAGPTYNTPYYGLNNQVTLAYYGALWGGITAGICS
jgi:hypothetical protein